MQVLDKQWIRPDWTDCSCWLKSADRELAYSKAGALAICLWRVSKRARPRTGELLEVSQLAEQTAHPAPVHQASLTQTNMRDLSRPSLTADKTNKGSPFECQ